MPEDGSPQSPRKAARTEDAGQRRLADDLGQGPTDPAIVPGEAASPAAAAGPASEVGAAASTAGDGPRAAGAGDPGPGGSGSGGGDPPEPPRAPVPGRPAPRRRRFVISQLLARHDDAQTRADMVDLFSIRLDRSVLPNADLLSDLKDATATRRVVVVDADPEELTAKRSDLTADAIIEPERPRVPAALGALLRFAGSATDEATRAAGPAGPGVGGELVLTLSGPNGESVRDAVVTVTFLARRESGAVTTAGGRSDRAGRVAVPFDPDTWLPVFALITPRSGYWGMPLRAPQSGQTVRLERLPTRGPFGWWQLLSGSPAFDSSAGAGITVGVVDTGVGPHPYLEHAVPVGAFLDGRFQAGPEAGRDASDHGTHVCGLIGARPPAEGGGYGGLAPGADLRVARVFAPDRLANQGDIALAVSALASTHNADLINLSLGGEPSEIERDAIILARREGALCVAAAGNGSGAPLTYPAAYPECAAVSALGLVGGFPAVADAAASLPSLAAAYGIGGLYLAAFSNVGPDMACTAGGTGVISTVPAGADEPAPYAEMSGTSMAAPLATAALAVLLSSDPRYRALPRSAARSLYAAQVLAGAALPIGLAQPFVGAGLARAR